MKFHKKLPASETKLTHKKNVLKYTLMMWI